MRKIYPSDITREDFEEIRLEMERNKPAQQDTASLGAERTREKANALSCFHTAFTQKMLNKLLEHPNLYSCQLHLHQQEYSCHHQIQYPTF